MDAEQIITEIYAHPRASDHVILRNIVAKHDRPSYGPLTEHQAKAVIYAVEQIAYTAIEHLADSRTPKESDPWRAAVVLAAYAVLRIEDEDALWDSHNTHPEDGFGIDKQVRNVIRYLAHAIRAFMLHD